jgi:hypothetical protein
MVALGEDDVVGGVYSGITGAGAGDLACAGEAGAEDEEGGVGKNIGCSTDMI